MSRVGVRQGLGGISRQVSHFSGAVQFVLCRHFVLQAKKGGRLIRLHQPFTSTFRPPTPPFIAPKKMPSDVQFRLPPRLLVHPAMFICAGMYRIDFGPLITPWIERESIACLPSHTTSICPTILLCQPVMNLLFHLSLI